MKKLKILFGCLLIASAFFTVVSCAQDTANDFLAANEDDDAADTETLPVDNYITGTASNAKVDSTNDNGGNCRTIVPLKTKHYGSRAKRVQTNIDEAKANGIMGYAFNLIYHNKGDIIGDTKETYAKNTIDFCLVSTTYAGNPIYYISAYRNVTDFQGKNFGVDDKNVFKAGKEADFLACTEACEFEITALPNLISSSDSVTGKRTKNLNNFKYDAEAKEFTVAINVTASDDGSYTVDFYKPEDVIKESGSWISSSKLKEVTNKQTVTIPNTVTGYSKKTQTLLGVYANIYPGRTLKGNWRLSGIKGEAEVEEFED